MDVIIDFSLEYDRWILFFHIAGSIVAIGAVVATDVILAWLHFKPKNAPLVAKISPLLSLQVWIGFFIIAASGFLLLLPRMGIEGSSIFQLKMLIVLIIFLNGVFLNVWVTPKFEELAPEWHKNTKKVRRFTKIAGITAMISFFGWWSVVLIMTAFY